MCDLSCLEQFAFILHCAVPDAVYVLSDFFHIRTEHFDIMKVLFIRQLVH